MHDQVQDQLPFYVAGTLSGKDSLILEQHLINCLSCQEALRQWRNLAEYVQLDASSRASTLRPLNIHEKLQERQSLAPFGRRLAAKDGHGRQQDISQQKHGSTLAQRGSRPMVPKASRFSGTLNLGAVLLISVLLCLVIWLFWKRSGGEQYAARALPALMTATSGVTQTPPPTSTLTPIATVTVISVPISAAQTLQVPVFTVPTIEPGPSNTPFIFPTLEVHTFMPSNSGQQPVASKSP